jgi:hypothetical protein
MRGLSMLLLMTGLGCGSFTNEPQLETRIDFAVSPPTAAVSDTLHLALTNRSTASVGYNLCFITIERRTLCSGGAGASAASVALDARAPHLTVTRIAD